MEKSIDIQDLSEFGMPSRIIEHFKENGIKNLFPPQAVAVLEGLLEINDSFLISVPTASGKTFISEMLMLRFLHEKKGKCLYIVPLRALAMEKFEEFKQYETLGIRTAVSTGELDTKESWLENYDIIITTSEKADSLMRHRSPWLNEIGVVVADEIHLINDGGRGPTLEVTLAKLMNLNPNLIVLGLSATIQNAQEVADWLGARLIQSDWRPVTLREGIYYDDEIYFSDSKLEEVERLEKDDASNLVVDSTKNNGQVLVFANTRKRSEKFASDIAGSIKKYLSQEEKSELKKLSLSILNTLTEPTKICRRLSKAVENGAAFHHAGLAFKQRKIVEEGFKSNLIKVLSATPTLAAGVNLPARRVIILDYKRFEANLGYSPIPVMEIKQMAGRAGRPKYDDYGEALFVAKTFDERSLILDNYILGEPEKIYSKLGIESALRTHVLSIIATGYTNTFQGVMEFFSSTFYAFQQDIFTLEVILENILKFLKDEGFLLEDDEYLNPTPFGRRASELYIDPKSAVVIKEALIEADKKDTNDFSYLSAICRTSEILNLYLRKKDYETCIMASAENEPYILSEIPDQLADPWGFEDFLSQIKTTLMFQDWIDERGEDLILDRFGLGPGDIRNRTANADWILYSMAEISRLIGFKKSGEIQKLRRRMRHGIKAELLDLVSLKGIGRARARRLFSRKYTDLESLRNADLLSIAKVELIGTKIARRIKEQLGQEVGDDEVESIENNLKIEKSEKKKTKEHEEDKKQKSLFDF